MKQQTGFLTIIWIVLSIVSCALPPDPHVPLPTPLRIVVADYRGTNLREFWQTSVNEVYSSDALNTTSQGLLFTEPNNLILLNYQTGHIVWQQPYKDLAMSLVSDHEKAYMINDYNKISAYRLTDGQVVWVSDALPFRTRSCCLYLKDGSLFLLRSNDADNHQSDVIYQFDPTTGLGHFVEKIAMDSKRMRLFNFDILNTPIYLKSDIDYFDNKPCLFWAYDSQTKKYLWQYTLGSNYIHREIRTLLVQGNILIMTTGPELFALDIGTGEVKWQKNHHISNAVIFRGQVYIIGLDGYIHIYDLLTGNLQGQIKVTSIAVEPRSRLLIANEDKGLLFAIYEKRMIAFKE